MSGQEKKPAPRIEVTLLKPHEHDGELCKVGAKIKVTDAQAKRLVSKGVIEDQAKANAGVK